MKIYLACFEMYKNRSDVLGYALCEDGHCLASHLSSSVGYSKHDMGLFSDWKHNLYKEHCPDGYELIWVDNPDEDENWTKAKELNETIYQKENEKAG